MKVKIVKNIKELYPYKDIWEKIIEENNIDIPFLQFDWIVKWWNYFGYEGKMYLLVVLEENVVKGFCPFMMVGKGLYKEIRFIGYPHASYADFLLFRDGREKTIEFIMDYLMGINEVFIFNLIGFFEDSPNYILLKDYMLKKGIRHYIRGVESPYILICDKEFDKYFKARSKHSSIRNIKKVEKRLKRLGNLEFKRIDDDRIEEGFNLHNKRWEKKLDTSRFTMDKERRFFKQLAIDREGPINACIYSLTVDERLIAIGYCFNCRERRLFYHIAHDDDFAIYGPGKILTKNIIKEAFINGMRIFDFSIGYERYKSEWTDEKTFVNRILFSTRGVISRIILERYIVKQKIIELLKKDYRIVMFKRNKLGLIRYNLERIYKKLRGDRNKTG